ncbi:hypothetical protein ACC772_20845 [Rhizobium ruizarguesonis]
MANSVCDFADYRLRQEDVIDGCQSFVFRIEGAWLIDIHVHAVRSR